MNTKIRSHKQLGFSLIEIMIAVLVLAIGILAVSKLQSSLIKSGSDANQRSIAANIAQKKIDDLKRFIHLNTNNYGNWSDLAIDSVTSLKGPVSLAFAHIANNEGGRVLPGTQSVGSNLNYNLSWSVIDYYYSGLNNSATTVAVTTYPSYKLAHVAVSWDGVGDNTNSIVSFDSIIYRYAPISTALGDALTTGNTGPTDKFTGHTGGGTPVILDTGDVQIGTLGEVAKSRKGNSNLVEYESLTYDPTNNKVNRRDQFSTVACVCEDGSASDSTQHLVGYLTWNNVDKNLVSLLATETYTTEYSERDSGGEGATSAFECHLCCKDGKDSKSIDFGINPDVHKVCRLKRTGGVLAVYPDWKLIGYNIVPEEFLNTTTNSKLYSTYVENVVRYAASIERTSGATYFLNTYSDINSSLLTYASSYIADGTNYKQLANGTSLNLQARAIYMDEVPDGVYEGTTYSTTNVPMDRIPFYEVSLTKLVGWAPDEDQESFSTTYAGFPTTYTGTQGDTATNEYSRHDPFPSGPDPTPCQSYDFANCVSNQVEILDREDEYSRGVFYSKTAGSLTTVESQIFTGSNGWVDVEAHVESLTTTTIPIRVTP